MKKQITFCLLGIFWSILFLAGHSATATDAKRVRFQKVPLAQKDGESEIRVSIEVDKTCHLGDFDLIERDATLSKNPQLRVSLEPILQKEGADRAVQTITLDEAKKGIRVNLRLPKKSSERHWGIFICQATPDSSTCQDKELQSFDLAMVTTDAAKQKDPKNFTVPSRVYFFQYLFRRSENGMDAPEENAMTPDDTKAFRDQMISLVPSNDKTNTEKALISVNLFNSTLKSIPVTVASEELQVHLPRYVKDATCGKTKTLDDFPEIKKDPRFKALKKSKS